MSITREEFMQKVTMRYMAPAVVLVVLTFWVTFAVCSLAGVTRGSRFNIAFAITAAVAVICFAAATILMARLARRIER